jgi:c-di-GMP-related signal transduction protein
MRHCWRRQQKRLNNTIFADRWASISFKAIASKQTILTGFSADPSKRLLLKIFCLIACDAGVEELEDALKQAPELMVRLLKMANIVGLQQVHKVRSLRKAIVLLGRAQIGRAVQVMVFARHGGAELVSDRFVQTAAVRGRLMGGVNSLGLAGPSDEAFMVGILSLADSLFSQSMVDILNVLNLGESLHDAFLHREGNPGALLNLAENQREIGRRQFHLGG